MDIHEHTKGEGLGYYVAPDKQGTEHQRNQFQNFHSTQYFKDMTR